MGENILELQNLSAWYSEGKMCCPVSPSSCGPMRWWG